MSRDTNDMLADALRMALIGGHHYSCPHRKKPDDIGYRDKCSKRCIAIRATARAAGVVL